MELEPKCNAMPCRRSLNDKAVVTTCSHIFCVDCANELFSSARLCPACETPLTEPDDVVVCSLHPSNDYKTSVLSGLNPLTILEICTRAISFWQYQIHQEHSFQQAVIRNMNDKNAQLQKQLDNVIREANGEISLLSNKITELHHDLDLERRRVRELQDASKERDKEYQKLKAQYDKMKRKTLLAPVPGLDSGAAFNAHGQPISGRHNDGNIDRSRPAVGFGGNPTNNIGAVVGGMEATGVQRTPIATRTSLPIGLQGRAWNQGQERNLPQGRHFGVGDRSFRTNTVSDRSDSAQEVENLLEPSDRHQKRPPASHHRGAWSVNHSDRSNQRIFAPSSRRPGGGFKPAGTMSR